MDRYCHTPPVTALASRSAPVKGANATRSSVKVNRARVGDPSCRGENDVARTPAAPGSAVNCCVCSARPATYVNRPGEVDGPANQDDRTAGISGLASGWAATCTA